MNKLNPFWVSGKVNGSTLQIMSTNGRKSFTVTRPAGQTTGVFKITFAEALTNSDYMINTTIQLSGYIKVWDSTTPTTSDFHVVTFNTSNNPVNCIFYFSVFAGM